MNEELPVHKRGAPTIKQRAARAQRCRFGQMNQFTAGQSLGRLRSGVVVLGPEWTSGRGTPKRGNSGAHAVDEVLGTLLNLDIGFPVESSARPSQMRGGTVRSASRRQQAGKPPRLARSHAR